MKLANCSICGKAFIRTSGGRDTCLPCAREEEENYSRIFGFFAVNPASTAKEISEVTGIDLEIILRYARENRLRFVKADNTIHCEACGEIIPCGKWCENCRGRLLGEVRSWRERFYPVRRPSLNGAESLKGFL